MYIVSLSQSLMDRAIRSIVNMGTFQSLNSHLIFFRSIKSKTNVNVNLHHFRKHFWIIRSMIISMMRKIYRFSKPTSIEQGLGLFNQSTRNRKNLFLVYLLFQKLNLLTHCIENFYCLFTLSHL